MRRLLDLTLPPLETPVQRTRLIATTATAGLVVGGLLIGTPASAQPKSSPQASTEGTVELQAKLHQLNRSGARGTATATVTGTTIDSFTLTARGLTPDGPHATHIHYGETAENECPTMGDATERRTDGSRRLTTSDGVPSYGPIVVTLTTEPGGTTPGDALDLVNAPMSKGGFLSYSRTGIEFTDVAGTGYGATGTGTAEQIAESIRAGEGVVVVHGVDYNGNGTYDFDSAGASDLTSAAPAEATDPALCGVLVQRNH